MSFGRLVIIVYHSWVTYYIMASHAFVVAKEVLIMETVVF